MSTDSTTTEDSPPRLVAVIDIGSTSLRMQIAEIQPDRSVRRIESFSQAVSLGDDTFVKKYISRETVEDCVKVLSRYREQLNVYGISERQDIRVVATSGLNEASNRLAFRDRIFVATGLDIEPFDEAELHRVTYMGVLPYIVGQPSRFSGQTLVLEVGGGTSEVLLLQELDVLAARTFPMGSLRLRKILEAYDAPLVKSRSLMESRIQQTIRQFASDANQPKPETMISMGSDMRFAAREISQNTVGDKLVELTIKQLTDFTNTVLNLTPANIAAKYHMSLPDAQSLAPSLLTHVMFARELGVQKYQVANANLREGLLREMAQGEQWSAAIQQQVVRSAIQLGCKFHFDQAFAVHVARLATMLFDQLQPLHELSHRYRITLEIASLLHDVGMFVNTRSRHKHSMYLIQNSELFGISASDLNLIALVARYNRGATPQPRHLLYGGLQRDKRIAVSKLSAILRIALALEQSRSQRIDAFTTTILPDALQIEVLNVADLTVEQLEVRQEGRLFESIFGKHIVLTTADKTE